MKLGRQSASRDGVRLYTFMNFFCVKLPSRFPAGCTVEDVLVHKRFTPGKDPISNVQEAGWAPGPVWTDGKFRPHRDSIPDRPARSQSLYRLSCPAQFMFSEAYSMTSVEHMAIRINAVRVSFVVIARARALGGVCKHQGRLYCNTVHFGRRLPKYLLACTISLTR